MSVLINSYISNINGPYILISIPNIVEKYIYMILSTIFKFNFEDRVLNDNNDSIIAFMFLLSNNYQNLTSLISNHLKDKRTPVP